MGSGQICFLLCLFLPQDRGLAVKRLSLIRLLALHNVLHNYQWTCFAPHFTWYERVLLEMGNSSCFNKTSRFGRMNKATSAVSLKTDLYFVKGYHSPHLRKNKCKILWGNVHWLPFDEVKCLCLELCCTMHVS